MSDTRDNILNRLRQNPLQATPSPERYQPAHDWDKEQRIERLSERMRAVRTEVIRLPDGDWMTWLNQELPARELNSVVVGENEQGLQFKEAAQPPLNVRSYEHAIEEWKAEFFNDIDVGITTTIGGIAETGSLILWPDVAEPRLLSLVPPVHIALLDANRIENTFADAVQQQQWSTQMPTNALLISGPSKTADIEQTLAYGIHGPKQLIVLILG